VEVSTYSKASSTTCDLAYTIFLSMGGTMAEIQEIYASNLDDLLYAIATRLNSGKVAQLVADFHPDVDHEDPWTVNYPAIIGATKLIVIIGGLTIDNVVTEGRYYTANLTAAAADGLEPGDIVFPAALAAEQILVLKF
jgi:hypothetical protein